MTHDPLDDTTTRAPTRIRQPLSFTATVLAALIGALIAAAVLAVAAYLYIDYKVEHVREQISHDLTAPVSGDFPDTPTPSTKAETECWNDYFAARDPGDFDTFAATHCPDTQ